MGGWVTSALETEISLILSYPLFITMLRWQTDTYTHVKTSYSNVTSCAHYYNIVTAGNIFIKNMVLDLGPKDYRIHAQITLEHLPHTSK